MSSSLGDNRYQMLFVDDDEPDVNVEVDGSAPAAKAKQQAVKKEKKVTFGGEKVKSLVINNNNYKNVGMSQTMLNSEQSLQQQQLQEERDLQRQSNNNGNNRERVFPTRNFRQSNAYANYNGVNNGNNNQRFMSIKERDAYNQQQEQLHVQQQPQQELTSENDTNNDGSTEYKKEFITIVEYEAMRNERAKPVYNIRQAGEGEMVRPEWQHMTILPKKKKNKPSMGNSGDGLGLGYDASMYPQRWRRQQRIDVEFKYKEDVRSTNSYRRRFSSRQMNNKNNLKDDRVVECNPIDVQDIAAFPTLR